VTHSVIRVRNMFIVLCVWDSCFSHRFHKVGNDMNTSLFKVWIHAVSSVKTSE